MIKKMKKCLLLYIFFNIFSFVSAQEYLPLHFSYKTIVPSKEKKVKLENISFVVVNEKKYTF